MKKQLLLSIIFLLMGSILSAQQLSQSFAFTVNELTFSQTGEYDRVNMPESSYLIGEQYAGQPQLPVKSFNLLLPAGAKATGVSVTALSKETLSGSFDLPTSLPAVGKASTSRFVPHRDTQPP